MALTAQYPFPANYFSTKAGKLHYVDVGHGPVVIMVHGNPTWSYMYRHLITALQGSYRVIAIDHLGCGKSDKPQDFPYRLRDHIGNLSALLGHLQIREFSLIVHDWGGPIGIGCALDRINELQRLVILNTAAFRSTLMPWRIRICRVPFLGAILVRGLNGFAGAAQYMAVEKTLPKDVARGFLAPYDSWKNRVAIHKFVIDIPLSPSHPSYETLRQIERGLSALRENRRPIFIGWGGRDFCFNDQFYKEWVARFPEAKTRYYPDAGHYVLEDKTTELISDIKQFLLAPDEYDKNNGE
jgi:pimeloyl-ACP methyl ester carboxylesterase